MKTLDDTDRKLIALLQDNARLPTVALVVAAMLVGMLLHRLAFERAPSPLGARR